ncbi:hypothetical protein DAEQUDRAFT_731348 [Daedalea quercina L-15889]|uniref:Secreted protein n=1 Tax=Daedalea quercina L-15889 TaxID=1314783 RepID=A0A165MD79_9APHY|nr:hypothetical protein DAEQUDRAFT_731348 [Daedalea quercina L-15889]
MSPFAIAILIAPTLTQQGDAVMPVSLPTFHSRADTFRLGHQTTCGFAPCNQIHPANMYSAICTHGPHTLFTAGYCLAVASL